LVALIVSLCWNGTAAEVLSLPLGVPYVQLTAGSTAPLPLGNKALTGIRLDAKVTAETEPAGRYSISVGTHAGGAGLFLAAPRNIPAGTYAVHVNLFDTQGRQYAGSFPVLIEAPSPVPQTERPPVILVNGFDTGAITQGACTLAEDSTETFGSLEEFLTTDGSSVLFFDNCTFGTPRIEVLGEELGAFITMLDHSDGSPVEEVNIVAFSMGALVARSYLAGKQVDPGIFIPPPDPMVRKLVLVAAENFGSPLANLSNVGEQIPQLKPGSLFTWELNTWHQGLDDLREVDALAIAGKGTASGEGDGVAPLAGASLSSAVFFSQEAERTRILPACHNQAARIFCNTADVIMRVDSEDHPSARIIRSFLAGTDEWRQIGETPGENAVLAAKGTAYFALKDAENSFVSDVTSVVASDPDEVRPDAQLAAGTAGIFVLGLAASGPYAFEVERPGESLEFAGEVFPGGGSVIEAKPGPWIARVIPSAGLVDTLSVAADSLISIFGRELAESEESTLSLPLPTELGGTMVTANDESLGLLYAGPNQINAFLPPGLIGLVRIKVMNSQGEHAVNVFLDDAVPAFFALDGSGQGPAAALHSLSSEIITADNPTSVGGFVSFYVTGLGPLQESNGLQVAVNQPEVFVGDVAAKVGFAGAAPGFVGLNQINIEILEGTPTGPAVPVSMRSGNRVSNEVTLAIE
jgi:uncharacterized protein (TIGR03437 family)